MAKTTKFGKTRRRRRSIDKALGSQAKNGEKNIANLYFSKNKTNFFKRMQFQLTLQRKMRNSKKVQKWDKKYL